MLLRQTNTLIIGASISGVASQRIARHIAGEENPLQK
jgi:hypothetical protein